MQSLLARPAPCKLNMLAPFNEFAPSPATGFLRSFGIAGKACKINRIASLGTRPFSLNALLLFCRQACFLTIARDRLFFRALWMSPS